MVMPKGWDVPKRPRVHYFGQGPITLAKGIASNGTSAKGIAQSKNQRNFFNFF